MPGSPPSPCPCKTFSFSAHDSPPPTPPNTPLPPPTSPQLADNFNTPVISTTPSDSFQTYSCSVVPTISEVAAATVALATPLTWTSVNVVASGHGTYQDQLAAFLRESAAKKLTVRSTFVLDGTDTSLASATAGLLASTSRVHVLFCSPEDAMGLIKQAKTLQAVNGDNIWVGTFSWLDAKLLTKNSLTSYVAGSVLGLVPIWDTEKKTTVDAKLILKSADSPGPGAYFAHDAWVLREKSKGGGTRTRQNGSRLTQPTLLHPTVARSSCRPRSKLCTTHTVPRDSALPPRCTTPSCSHKLRVSAVRSSLRPPASVAEGTPSRTLLKEVSASQHLEPLPEERSQPQLRAIVSRLATGLLLT